MGVSDKTKLMNEIEEKIQSLNLLLSTIKSDKSRKPETLAGFRKMFEDLLGAKKKK